MTITAPGKMWGIEFLAKKRPIMGTVALCHGVFDLLHIGHIRHLEEAKKLADTLIVTITSDEYVNKGPDRPAFNQHLRAEALAALSCVDYVSVNPAATAVPAIRLLKPDFYVKGPDYKDVSEKHLSAEVEAVHGRIVFTNDVTFSSSRLINQHLQTFPDGTSKYLAEFSSSHSYKAVLGYMESARFLKILVVGEPILDEYIYCETLGKSGKEPILAVQETSQESFQGGSAAIATNTEVICNSVGRFPATFVPIVVKRRYVETYPPQKLFEVYVGGSSSVGHDQRFLCEKLAELLPRYHLVMVADFGHRLLGPAAIDLICSKSKFLAVNTQANAGNRGYNVISKYPQANYVCISETELRLDAHDHDTPVKDLVVRLHDKHGYDRILITRGALGSLAYSPGTGFSQTPSLSTSIVDRIGAGDAVFSVTAPLACVGTPMDILGFVGNVAGAEAVATVGHRTHLERAPFFKHIETLLK
jgi:rfaE bifunctional protein nucleotidyltransferase chain/domain